MEKFINTKKEQFLGFDFLKNHTLPSRDVFDYRVHKKEYSEYFAQYGFQVSMVYADFYSRMWCSDYNDRYMSDDVYYYYVIPCLNRFDFINSYMDKNGYDRLFPDIKKPSILMKNINGRFFSPDDMPISTEEAVKLVLATDLDCIIKPSIDSGSGKNVKLVRKEEIDTAKVKDLFETYKWDFNIQKRLEQSATLILAIAKKHGKSTVQIVLRWLVQRGIIVIPKTWNMVHLKENISILDFELSVDEMAEITSLNKGRYLNYNPFVAQRGLPKKYRNWEGFKNPDNFTDMFNNFPAWRKWLSIY